MVTTLPSLERIGNFLVPPRNDDNEDNPFVYIREMTTQAATTPAVRNASDDHLDDPNGSSLLQQQQQQSGSLGLGFYLFFWGFVSLLRIAIGFHPHSGQDNYHGSLDEGAYGGDFEAQRHWMELTVHLPIGDWYWYDKGYWGLDYPPLTAYVSWICGVASHSIVGPASVALEASRGIEDPTHKAFMRGTVLVLDLLVYGTAVWYATYEKGSTNTNTNRNTNTNTNTKSLWTILVTLCQPAILLIDHGHFQYNTVALGLSIASFSFLVQSEFGACVWGGFFFALALNFKQTTLYYAPAVFFYLLGRCCASNNANATSKSSSSSSSSRWWSFVSRISWLGGVVLLTFYVLWEPFVKYAPSLEHSPISIPPTPLERLAHVLRRIFPFERGLFEGKVANLWCALNTSPVKIRSRIPAEYQPLLALAGTIGLMLPSCWKVLTLGMEQDPTSAQSAKQHRVLVLWAMTSCALSFFLASFQVHEKSILLALAPCSLLLWEDPVFVEWFSVVCLWSLWPLLTVDRLQVAYWCMGSVFASMVWFRRITTSSSTMVGGFSPTSTTNGSVFSGKYWIWMSLPDLSFVGMMGLHMAQVLVPAPSHLPDLYEVLWSVAGCGMVSFAWSVTIFKLYFSALSRPSTLFVKEKGD